MTKRDLLVAAAIMRDRYGRVLLVANDWQRGGRVRYTLPGGTVEMGELVHEALIREVLEETGLHVTHIDCLAYVVHIEDDRRRERAVAMVFEVEWEGIIRPNDPDGYIVEARFVLPDEAARLIETPPLRDPLYDYLLEGEAGRFYAFNGWDGRGGVRIPVKPNVNSG